MLTGVAGQRLTCQLQQQGLARDLTFVVDHVDTSQVLGFRYCFRFFQQCVQALMKGGISDLKSRLFGAFQMLLPKLPLYLLGCQLFGCFSVQHPLVCPLDTCGIYTRDLSEQHAA